MDTILQLHQEIEILNRIISEKETEIEQEKFNHNMTRIAWDTTIQKKYDLKNEVNALSAIKKGLEKSLSESFAEIERLKGLIELAYSAGFNRKDALSHNHDSVFAQILAEKNTQTLEQFKTKNNLS